MTGWDGDQLDLDALVARIGYDGELAPTRAVLDALHRAYTTTMPFENLEIMLGRSIPLDVESLQDKLVARRRGGYCFEHGALFAALLERLGFRFSALVGRVTMGAPPASRLATHALLAVEFDDGTRKLCDVGFGRGPLEPLELRDGLAVDQGGWRLRLDVEPLGADAGILSAQEWILRQRSEVDGEVGWLDRHHFALAPRYPIDFAVGNHYVSTSPRSPFTMRPFIQRFHADRQDTLDGATWTTIAPDGRIVAQRTVEIGEIPALLADVFDIELGADDAAALLAALPGLPAMSA
mgnify:CR=1 FL=1|jgi:N-hydroxyarylamine O-acetyltransferase